jgi:tyrosine-protein phosphatase non-receptor type 9
MPHTTPFHAITDSKSLPPSGTLTINYIVSKSSFLFVLLRYSNIFPYDSCLVKLGDDPKDPEFINASWIRFEDLNDRPYIVTIGPMHPSFYGPDTCKDFWKMVWEQKIPVITGLARVERGFSGTARYWPAQVNSSIEFGDFKILMLEVSTNLTLVSKRQTCYGLLACARGEGVWVCLVCMCMCLGVCLAV